MGREKNWGQMAAGQRRAIFSMVEPTSQSQDKKYRVEARDLDGNLLHSWEFPFQNRILLVVEPDVKPAP